MYCHRLDMVPWRICVMIAVILQIFPGGYFLCQPGHKTASCITASPGKRRLLGGASAETAPHARGLLGSETHRDALIYPVEPNAPISSTSATSGTSHLLPLS